MNMWKTSFLELNGVDMSHSSTKKAFINELDECLLLLLKDPSYNIRTISSYLPRKKILSDLWPLGIGSYSEEEVWFMEMPTDSHSILE